MDGHPECMVLGKSKFFEIKAAFQNENWVGDTRTSEFKGFSTKCNRKTIGNIG
jgi:hypothetical protein